MTNRVLLTGATGFIGHHLLHRLREQGIPVMPYERDVCTIRSLNEAYGTVIHLAAKVLPNPRDAASMRQFLQTNVLGLQAVIEYVSAHASHLIYASSSAVYGEPPTTQPLSEATVCVPQTTNGLVKLLGENVIATQLRGLPSSATILRLFNVYGPGQQEPFLIPYVIRCLQQGQQVVLKHPNAIRDFVYVEDATQAIVMLTKLGVEGGTHRVFNLGSGVGHRIVDVVRVLQRLTGKAVLVTDTAGSTDEVQTITADIAALQSATGWWPHTTLSAGLCHCLHLAS